MAWQDRDYNREEEGGGGGIASRLSSHSLVTWLLAINAIVFVLDMILTPSARGGGFSPSRWGVYNSELALSGLQFWRFLTYQFLHWDFLHLFFNMLGLYFFGPLIERWFGSRRFLAFYLLCGVSGAVVYTVLEAAGILPARGVMKGASGSLFGILVGAAVLFPKQRVMLLIPPIPMTMRTMALVFLGIAVLSLIVGAPNAGGEAAHLGGAALGFVLVRFPWLLNWADGLSGSGVARVTQAIQTRKQERQQHKDEDLEAEVDRILAKVKAQGLHSLTDKEKKTLQKATERQRWAG